MAKLNLAIIFGSKAPEHEVSIVTAFQALKWVDQEKYNCHLLYITPQNETFLCPSIEGKDFKHFIEETLKKRERVQFVQGGIQVKKLFAEKRISLDAALLLMHGSYGEGGKIQGMLDFYGIPYTGSDVLGSSVAMDKVVTNSVFKSLGLTVSPYVWFFYSEFAQNEYGLVAMIEKKLKYPLFVKPANAGSSIGISKVHNKEELVKAIKLASQFDRKILVEQARIDAVDINCSVLGGDEVEVSVCEQPISDDEFLTFKEKYLKGGKTKGMAGLSRVIPAPIPGKKSREIQEMAKTIFRAMGCHGVCRIDFMYQKKTGKVFPGEVNTIPGSLAYYLWEASGIKPSALIDKLIALAIQRTKELGNLNYNFKSEILDQK